MQNDAYHPFDTIQTQDSSDVEPSGKPDGSVGRPAPSRPLPPVVPELTAFGELYGSSAVMLKLYDEIGRVAVTDATVFVVGESGTGKELVARALHRESRRSAAPFVAVNCGAIPQHLLEAELFGHEKGSFTGAHQQHAGVFERASSGTLFLDEVTETAPEMQVKLLRVLETGRFYRVGGTVPVDVDLRVIAATNKEPRDAVAAGTFREDLLYRLAVFPLRVPPLRERGDDAVGLAQIFLQQQNRKAGTAKLLSRRALDAIHRQSWPGNVRELRNCVQRGFILADEEVDLPESAPRPSPRPVVRPGLLDLPVGTPLANAQREMILATLDHFGGSKPDAAEALGVSLKTLYNRLQQYQPASVEERSDPADAADSDDLRSGEH